MEITVKKLTAEKFALYGDIIHHAGAETAFPAPEEDILTCTVLVPQMQLDAGCLAQMLVCKARPMVVEKMERHADTAEILISTKEDYVLCVAPPAEEVAEDQIEAFLIPAGSTIVMKPSCWHWIPFPTGTQDAEVIVVFRAETVNDDLIYSDLAEKVLIK